MDIMSLLAKLTLDKTEYDKGLQEAEKDAKGLSVPPVSVPKPNTEDFKAGLKEAEDTGNLFKEVMSGVWAGVKDAILVTGITTTIAGIIGSLRQGIDLAAKNGDAISKGAKNLKISTRAYQEYEYTLGKSGLKVTDLNTALKNMDNLMGGKKLTKDQSKYLEELGINAEEAANREQLLADVMGSLASYKGSDKGMIINWLFGNNEKWDGYFDQTESEIQKLKEEADSLGLIMSDESVQNAANFNDAVEKLGDRLEAIKRSFGEGILPIITDAVNKLMMIVDFFTSSDERSATEKFEDQDKKYENRLKEIQATKVTAETLASTLLNMGDTSKMDQTQLAIWKGTANSLIELIPSLSEVIDVENGTISESIDGIGELISQYTELEKQTAYQTTKAEKQNIIDQKRNKLVEEATTVNNKLAEAEGKRNQAIDEYNKVLKKYGHEGLGYDATLEDINKAQTDVLNAQFGDDTAYAQAYEELRNARSPLTTAIGEAQAAQTEVKKLTADVEEGQAALDAWVSSQESLYAGVSETAQSATEDLNGVTNAVNDMPDEKHIYIYTHHIDDGAEGSYAIGSAYIPYDQTALLHRGERVLTATENRRGEGGGNIDYTQLENRIVASIRAGMDGATVNSYINGKKVTDEVNRQNINAVKGRRFSR